MRLLPGTWQAAACSLKGGLRGQCSGHHCSRLAELLGRVDPTAPNKSPHSFRRSFLAASIASAISRLLRVFPGARRASRAQRKTVPRSQTMGSARADARSPIWPRQTGLDGIRIGASRKQGHHNDFDVEQKRPIIYVVQIALDAPPHLLHRISFSAMAVPLGPAGNARLDLMAA